MKRKDLARRATSAALAACMMFTLSAPALAESTDALMQLSTGSYRSSSLLSEENSFPTIKVNGTLVNEANINSILTGVNANKLSYDKANNTLKFSGMITGDLTIDAPGVNIELYSNSTSEPAVRDSLTVTNAADVKVTSENHIAVVGNVEISCDGKVEITSGRNTAVYGSVTVDRADGVEISGKKDGKPIVIGDVTIACNVPVTILNNGMGGMANSIVCSGEYVYSAAENGPRVDPRITPIVASTNAVYITPAVAKAITLTNATVNVPDNKAYEGTQVTATVNAPAGTRFDSWESTGVVLDETQKKKSSITFEMPPAEITLTAVCKTLHALTVKNGTVPGGTSTTKPNNQTTTSAKAAKGDVVEIEGKNFDSARKAFDQWKVVSGDAEIPEPYKEKTTLTVTGEGEVTVKASYMTPRTVTVTDGNGTVMGLTKHGTDNIFAGDKVEVTANELPGKLFDHWECAPELKDESDNPLTEDAKKNSTVTFKMPQGNVTLTAVYKEAKSFTLKHGTILSVTRGGVPVPVTDNMELFAGDTVEITPNKRLSEKLKFGRWNVKSGNVTLNGGKTATFTMPDEPVELEAVYNNLYTATVNDGTATTTKNGVAGTEVTVTANVPEGEKFTGWKVENNTALSLNGQSIDLTQPEITFNMPSTDITLTAEHKTIHTLKVVGGIIDENGSDTIQAIAGDTITVHSKLTADQQFLCWKSDDIGLTDSQSKNDPLTIKMPDRDVTITAVPKQLYTVTVVNGTVHDKSADTANPGDTVTINAADRTALGEVFVGWTVKSTDANGKPNVQLNDPTAESTTFTMIGANVEVEAKYEKQYHVTVLYQTETGTPTEDISQKKTAIYGDNIAVTAEDKTADGLIFDHWEVKVDGLDVPGLFADYEKADASFKMRRADVTLTAVYKKLYTITITNNVNNDVYEAGKTKVGGTVPLEAAPIPDYRFKNWNVLDDNAVVSDAGILTLNDDGDVLVQAEYVKLYDLTVTDGKAYDEAGNPAASAAEGDLITAKADPVRDKDHFTGWTSNVTLTKDNVALTEDELKNPDITFDMPKGDVELKANYSYVYDQTVKVTYGKAYTADTTADAEIIATPGETVYIEPEDRMADNWFFTGWKVTGGTGVTLDYAPNGTVSFTMPQSAEAVEITAQYAKLHAVTVNGGTAAHKNGNTLLNMNDGSHGAIKGDSITIEAYDKSAEGKVFDHWEVTKGNVTLNDDGSFEMPDEAVEITAWYANVHDVTVHSEGSTDTFKGIKVGTDYTVTAPEISGKRFLRWVVNLGDVRDLDKKAGTFTMPDGNVDLTAEYVDLYDLTVTYGAAADANDNPATSAAAGDRITVTADEPDPTETFEGWTLISGTIHDDSGAPLPMDDEGYILNADGTRLTKRSFAFVMGGGAVELKANYSMPAYVMAQRVIVEGGTAFAEGEAAAAEIIVDPGKRITVIADSNADSNMIFDYWEVTSLDEDGKVTVKLEDATSMTTSFTMPMAPVELTAHWRTIDEAPSSGGAGGAGAAIAGVAIGGAAVWGGYEITTRVILNDLLPEGAAIPANRGQLALLVWQTAGKPEPAAQPAFADITDAELAKAAQWCVEQGLLDAREGKFESDGWMPKFKTIEIWNKAFPKK